ncbi:phBC6A51 family helix-turn-helix protein [Vagococcus sp. JNUCC 83]
MSDLTKDNKYKTTPAEKRLLEVLVNPDYLGKSITEICKVAGISRFKYYDAMKKEEFRQLVNDTTMDLIKGKAADVLNATYKFAMTDKGHQDRKMLLTIADIYKDKQEVKHSGVMDIKQENSLVGLSFEELKELASSRYGSDKNEST